jgi:peptidyl-tRNA hydrolase
MDKDEALWVESKLNLDPNGEFKSISLINMTHSSLEETLDKITLRVTNLRKILDNKMTNECHRHGMMGDNIFTYRHS